MRALAVFLSVIMALTPPPAAQARQVFEGPNALRFDASECPRSARPGNRLDTEIVYTNDAGETVQETVYLSQPQRTRMIEAVQSATGEARTIDLCAADSMRETVGAIMDQVSLGRDEAEWALDLETAVLKDTALWSDRAYEAGSMGDISVRQDEIGDIIARGSFSYTDGRTGWVEMTRRNGNLQCMEYDHLSRECVPEHINQGGAGAFFTYFIIAVFAFLYLAAVSGNTDNTRSNPPADTDQPDVDEQACKGAAC